MINLDIDNRTMITEQLVRNSLHLANKLVFSSVRKSRRPRRLSVIVKPLHPRSADANPTGWTGWPEDKKSPVILRIADDPARYPDMYSQAPRLEYPHIQMRSPLEALLLIACHEFAHIALNCSGYGSPRQYYAFPNFEEWVCENIAMCSLQIIRSNVNSNLI